MRSATAACLLHFAFAPQQCHNCLAFATVWLMVGKVQDADFTAIFYDSRSDWSLPGYAAGFGPLLAEVGLSLIAIHSRRLYP
jgi:hypothetical protein